MTEDTKLKGCGNCKYIDIIRNSCVCGKKGKIIFDLDDYCNEWKR